MRWCYKTVYFELKKDGLLGSAFLDDAEMEETLNEFGKAGWELVSMVDTRDGVLAVFKQPIKGIHRPATGQEAAEEYGEQALNVAPVIPAVAEDEYEEIVAVEDGELTEESSAFDEEADLEPRAWLEQPAEEVFEDVDLDEADETSKSGDPDEYEEDEDPGVGSIRIE